MAVLRFQTGEGGWGGGGGGGCFTHPRPASVLWARKCRITTITDTRLPSRKTPYLSSIEGRVLTNSQVQCCLKSTETVRTVRDGEPRTATSTLTQLLSSDKLTTDEKRPSSLIEELAHPQLSSRGTCPPPPPPPPLPGCQLEELAPSPLPSSAVK